MDRADELEGRDGLADVGEVAEVEMERHHLLLLGREMLPPETCYLSGPRPVLVRHPRTPGGRQMLLNDDRLRAVHSPSRWNTSLV